MEYHVRSARLTDIDPAIRILMQDAPHDEEMWRDGSERLRSLLYLPSATVVVAEAERQLLGVGVLSIRPSVRSGPFVGLVDELATSGPDTAPTPADGDDAPLRERIGCSILEQLVASARNKGCTRVDVTDPLASAEPSLLEQAGFARRGALLSRAVG